MDGGYSKINIDHSQDSRSMEFSDLGSKTQLESNLQMKNKVDHTSSNKQDDDDDEIQHQDRNFAMVMAVMCCPKKNYSILSRPANLTRSFLEHFDASMAQGKFWRAHEHSRSIRDIMEGLGSIQVDWKTFGQL
ncbi:hypothetical protein ACLB2K_047303 [Fragaria x ananassa]